MTTTMPEKEAFERAAANPGWTYATRIKIGQNRWRKWRRAWVGYPGEPHEEGYWVVDIPGSMIEVPFGDKTRVP